MNANTRTIIECAMAQDLSMTEAEVAAVKRAMDWREGGDELLDAPPLDAPLLFVPYAEAARRLGVTVNAVKEMVKDGRLARVYRGRQRAVGVTPESLRKCLRS